MPKILHKIDHKVGHFVCILSSGLSPSPRLSGGGECEQIVCPNTIHNCQGEADVQNSCLINLSNWDALTGYILPSDPVRHNPLKSIPHSSSAAPLHTYRLLLGSRFVYKVVRLSINM